MDAMVIGGGVIGLCLAAEIDRLGGAVTVIEAGACGGQASAGNSGWITPGLSVPVPAPGTVPQALRWMFRPSSPLLVHPSWLPGELRWGYEFWRSTSRGRYGAGIAALLSLNALTLQGFDDLEASGVEFEMHRDGMLLVAEKEMALEQELEVLRKQQALGYPGRISVLGGAETRALEPAVGSTVVGSIFAADERHVRPESLTAGLRDHLLRRCVAIREGVRASRLEPAGDGWAVHLDGGERATAASVILATGFETGSLLKPFDIRLPLVGGKGYSITEHDPVLSPRLPLHLLERKVGVSPMSQGVRLAGTMELGAADLRLRPRRLQALDSAAERYLDGWRPTPTRSEWAGFRPLLPDGLPAIGPVPGWDGLFVATGHSMLGVTLAPATARLLAPAVLGTPLDAAAAPFSLARFGNLGRRID